jgi:hypothetical protein
MRRAAFLRALCLAGLATLGIHPVMAQLQPENIEPEVRAVFLLRMAQFTDWPATPANRPDAPFEFCVVQDEAFRALLESAVRAERIGGRPAVVLGVPATGPEVASEQLYVPDAQRKSAPRILARLPGLPTLTVGGYEGFLRQGGAVEMYLDRGNIRFRINRRAAESAGLALRSQLLRAAAAVTED